MKDLIPQVKELLVNLTWSIMLGVMKTWNVQDFRPYCDFIVFVCMFYRFTAFSTTVWYGFFHRYFDSVQFPSMERRHGDPLHARGIYWVTMDIEEEPTHVIDIAIFLNNKDESFSFLCLSSSKDLLFHLSGLKNPKDIWDQLASLYGK